MKTTYIHQLPEILKGKIYVALKEIIQDKDLLDEAINSRLSDLEDTIDIRPFIAEMEFWKNLGREVAQFELGDTLWDKTGKLFLVVKNPSLPNRITAETAISLYKDDLLEGISTQEEVLNFDWKKS